MKHILLLMMLFEVSLMGKAQSMSGKVVDKDSHEAIIGAVVYVGSSQKVAAITDINGRFSIDAANAGKSLKITYIGYKNYLGKLNQALYEMEPEIKSVGEVVYSSGVQESGFCFCYREACHGAPAAFKFYGHSRTVAWWTFQRS